MDINQQLERLENTILQQARELAAAQRQAAQQQREQILASAAKRLRQQEERQLAAVQIAAERVYQRRVQASEIKMQAELDQLRWSLVQAVMVNLREQLRQLTHQRDRYLTVLKQYLSHAVTLLDDSELVIEVNPLDYTLLSPQWNDWVKEVTTKQCTLAVHSRSSIGGLLVRDSRDRVRVDNTFEGLIERLENELHQIIISQLFAMTTPLRNI